MKKYLLDEIMKLAIEELETKNTTENTKILEDVLGLMGFARKRRVFNIKSYYSRLSFA